MPNTENLKPFKPGQSGNPGGYSKGRRQIDDLLDLIDEKGATRAISAAWLKKILAGDPRHLKEFLDRRDGRPAEKIEIKDDTSTQAEVSPDSLAQAVNLLKELGIARAITPVLPTQPDTTPSGVLADG